VTLDGAVVARDGGCKIAGTVRVEIAVEVDTADSIGVMVVDDQATFRRVARAVINATAGFQPIADAASGVEALRNADHEHPDLVLMDVYMPQMDGFEATRRLTEAHPEAVVVLVSVEDVEDLAEEVKACGAVGFIHKRDLRPATLRALWTSQRGAA
jgi:two-component system, NarL family, invasion response regulator UvrY